MPHEAAAALPALSVAADRSAAATLSVAMTMPATRQRERKRGSMRVRRLMGVLSRERGLRLAPWSGGSAATVGPLFRE